jgi:hypothetical protein
MTSMNNVPHTPLESVQMSQSVNDEIHDENDHDDETCFDYTPVDSVLDDDDNNGADCIRQFHPPASYSGRFSPSNFDNQGESASSQLDYTEPTQEYDLNILPASSAPSFIPSNTSPMEIFMAHPNNSSISNPLSSFNVRVEESRPGDGLLRPPTHTRRNPPSVTLNPSKKYITRSSPSTNKKNITEDTNTDVERVSQFHKKSWEYINETLHGRYRIDHTNPSVIMQEGINIRNAIKDMDDLNAIKINELEDDKDLGGVKMWYKKLKKAKATAEVIMEEDEDSDEAESLYDNKKRKK